MYILQARKHRAKLWVKIVPMVRKISNETVSRCTLQPLAHNVQGLANYYKSANSVTPDHSTVFVKYMYFSLGKVPKSQGNPRRLCGFEPSPVGFWIG